AVGGAHQRVDRTVYIGIRHHHHVVLGATQALHALAVAGARLVDVLGDGGGAGEADGAHVGVFQQRVDRFLVALHHVEHALGQAGFTQQLGHEQRGARIGGAGLEDEGIAGGDGDRVHPHGHHHRKVERRDAGHHA
ncbi:hypothetical protein QT19_00070, partial [Staphylococcus aureus]